MWYESTLLYRKLLPINCHMCMNFPGSKQIQKTWKCAFALPSEWIRPTRMWAWKNPRMPIEGAAGKPQKQRKYCLGNLFCHLICANTEMLKGDFFVCLFVSPKLSFREKDISSRLLQKLASVLENHQCVFHSHSTL